MCLHVLEHVPLVGRSCTTSHFGMLGYMVDDVDCLDRDLSDLSYILGVSPERAITLY